MKDITTEEAVEYVKDILKYPKLYASTENEGDFLRGIDKNKIEKVLNELEKKDKIIDAMVEFIDTELSSERLTRVLKKEVLPLETYREDIKQYFERIVENE